MRRKPRLKVNEGPFVSEYFEQQDIQAVGLTHALDVAPLRNELEDVEATHQVQNLAANESTGTLREVWRPDRQTAPSRRYSGQPNYTTSTRKFSGSPSQQRSDAGNLIPSPWWPATRAVDVEAHLCIAWRYNSSECYSANLQGIPGH